VKDFAGSSFALSVAAVAAAYLAGSIPFGYLVARWVRGIDIRTVGSGNLGATNVGRTLGFRYFWLVLLLDLLKGYLPTIGFPWLLNRFFGSCPVDLPVLLALAAIGDQPGRSAGARLHFVWIRRAKFCHFHRHITLCLAIGTSCRGGLRGRPLPA
jgi:hypothetical protein